MSATASRFTLTSKHVLLLRRACVGWEDCESGAPAIDCKRPYGNSSVWEDVAEIIGLKPMETDNDEAVWPKGTREKCTQLHRETELALQIVLSSGSFDIGEFERINYRWHRVIEEPK